LIVIQYVVCLLHSKFWKIGYEIAGFWNGAGPKAGIECEETRLVFPPEVSAGK